METSLLKTVGQIAGIGGIALGVLLLVFRDVIRRNIFPRLASIQAYRLICLIVVLTFLIAAIGIGAWVYVQENGTPLPSQDTVLWSKNWATLSEPLPWMGSSEGYSATNRERLLRILKALDLSSATDLTQMRANLVMKVERAEARSGDSTYNMLVPRGFDAEFQLLKRGVRDRAIAAGVSITGSP